MNYDLLKNNRQVLFKISLANFIANIPRGIFNILLYFIIVHLVLSIATHTPLSPEALKKYSWWYAGFFLVYIFLSLWSQTNNYVKAYEIAGTLRLQLSEKLRKIPLSFFKQKKSNNVALKLLGSVQKAEMIISRILPEIATAVVVPVILIIFLAFLNWKLACVMLIAVFIAGVFLQISKKIITKLGDKHLSSINKASFEMLEYLKTIKLLKSYNLIGNKFGALEKSISDLNKMTFKIELWAGIPMQIFLFLLDVGYLATFLLAVHFYLAGSLPIQNLVAFAVLGFYFYEPLKSVGTNLVEMRYALLSTKFIEDILKTPEVRHKKTPLPEKNHFEFKNVYFDYGNKKVLKGINCTIKEKSMTALVGSSGAGKSTMTNLIARFWDSSDGEILLDGINLKEIDSEKLLDRISVVFQDVYLFNDTIANNIRVGKKDTTFEEIQKAAKLARCDEFIKNLPDGYNTMISEGGGSLSGGQRQRLSIARAILKNAPIIMLDEATASLDPENEAEIQKAIENLVKDKTVIVIAHRFRSIINADQILVLDNGIITEKGTHQELSQSNGLYAKLWQEQQKARGWKFKETRQSTINN